MGERALGAGLADILSSLSAPCLPLTLAGDSGPTLFCLCGLKPLQRRIPKHIQSEMPMTHNES